jgi:hypothetical protein
MVSDRLPRQLRQFHGCRRPFGEFRFVACQREQLLYEMNGAFHALAQLRKGRGPLRFTGCTLGQLDLLRLPAT